MRRPCANQQPFFLHDTMLAVCCFFFFFVSIIYIFFLSPGKLKIFEHSRLGRRRRPEWITTSVVLWCMCFYIALQKKTTKRIRHGFKSRSRPWMEWSPAEHVHRIVCALVHSMRRLRSHQTKYNDGWAQWAIHRTSSATD